MKTLRDAVWGAAGWQQKCTECGSDMIRMVGLGCSYFVCSKSETHKQPNSDIVDLVIEEDE